jgi:hypothetical protein
MEVAMLKLVAYDCSPHFSLRLLFRERSARSKSSNTSVLPKRGKQPDSINKKNNGFARPDTLL